MPLFRIPEILVVDSIRGAEIWKVTLHLHFSVFGFRTANCAYKAIGRPYIY